MVKTQPARRAAQEHQRLAHGLRDLRRRAGLGGVETAHRAGISQATISRIENCRIVPSRDTVRRLCDVYNATPSERDQLLELAERVREESKRTRVVLPRGAAQLQATFAKMDAKASVRRTFSTNLVPGLLQTPDYIRVLFEGEIPAEEIEQTVEARLARRRQLARKKTTQQHILVMTEGALRWQVGSAGLMVEQIELIIEASRAPNLRVGIIPWVRPVRFVCTHGFNVYDSAAVLVGTEVASVPYTEPDDVQVYLDMFTKLEDAAVFGEDARLHLARIANDYRLLT